MQHISEAMSQSEVVKQYFSDIDGVLIKKLNQFMTEKTDDVDENRLLALTQELIKVKKLITTK